MQLATCMCSLDLTISMVTVTSMCVCTSQASVSLQTVEIYVLLCAVLHVAVALKRTWDISLNYTLASGKLNLAISGVMLLTFMCMHLFQFRFGATIPYKLCPPPYLINLQGIIHLKHFNLFWTEDCH